MESVKFPPGTAAKPERSGAAAIDRLLDAGYPHLGEAEVDAFIAPAGLRVIFVTGDPVKLLDSVDIAVVLPELERRFFGRIAAAVCQRGAEAAMAARYGADVKPALVFFAAGRCLGTIPRIRDWDDYVVRIAAWLGEAAVPPAPTLQ